MGTIDIFSRIELPKKDVYDYLSYSSTISRFTSPFFKLDNLRCKSSTLDLNTHFIQKCIFLEFFQLYFAVEEIIPEDKIQYNFQGLIKGTQSINFLEDNSSCILREKIEFSLYNQFNLPLFDFILSIFFYIDIFIKHLRIKSALYKDFCIEKENLSKESYAIRSYIVVDSNLGPISSLFEELGKFALCLPSFVRIKGLNGFKELKEGQEFSLEFLLPFLPEFSCKIEKKDSKKMTISFSAPFLRGNNSWKIISCEKQCIIENSIQLNIATPPAKLFWFILGNTAVKAELINWSKRLKEVSEKTNALKYFYMPVT